MWFKNSYHKGNIDFRQKIYIQKENRMKNPVFFITH